MKFLKVGLSAALAAMVMLTSCLSEGSTESSGYGFGVITASSSSMYTPMLYLREFYPYPISSNSLSLYDEKVVQVYYVVDLQSESNTNFEERKYINGSIQVLEEYNTVGLRHTSELNIKEPYENEIAFDDLAIGTYIQNFIIMGTDIKELPKDSKITYIAQYDANQEPTIEDNQRIYEIYIRATVAEGTDSKKEDFTEIQGFKFDTYFSYIENREKEVDDTYFYIRVNYPSEVDHEKNEIKWKTANMFQTFVVKQ